MVKVYYYSKVANLVGHDNLLNELYQMTSSIEKDYPSHYKWFHEKFTKELDGNKREIIFCADKNNIYGVIFLKNSNEEKKLCTVMVNEKFRKMGVGTALLEEAFKFLGTTKPVITMPDYKEKCFRKIIDRYEWEIKQTIDSYYSDNKELIFNGYIG